jgi:photosystem II stability/assembly factor-like uncharacterized protein
MRKIVLAALLPLLFGGCYFTNTAITPNPAGFHTADMRKTWGGALIGERFTGIAWGAGTLAAVTHEGTIVYSTDSGRGWDRAELDGGMDIRFSSVAWGAGWFLAGGDGGKAACSADGIHWETGVIGPMNPKDIYGVAAGDIRGSSVFVVVGNDGRICYSTDGPQGNWRLATLTPFGQVDNYGETIRAVAYGKIKGGGVFVAVGDDAKIAVANDVTGRWYGGRTGLASQTYRAVTFGGDRFLAVGDAGMVKYSTDPVSCHWTAGDGGIFGLRNLIGAAYDPLIKQFVVIGSQAAVGFSVFGDDWTAASFMDRMNGEEFGVLACTDTNIIICGEQGSILFSN